MIERRQFMDLTGCVLGCPMFMGLLLGGMSLLLLLCMSVVVIFLDDICGFDVRSFRVFSLCLVDYFRYIGYGCLVGFFIFDTFSMLALIMLFWYNYKRWYNLSNRDRRRQPLVGMVLCSCGLLVFSVFIVYFWNCSNIKGIIVCIIVGGWVSLCANDSAGDPFFGETWGSREDSRKKSKPRKKSEQRKVADEWKRKEAQRQEEEERRRKKVEETERFLVSLFSMAAKMAKADGVADASEVRMAEQLFTLLNIQGPQREKLKNAFNAALLHPEGIYADADTVAAYVGQLEARAFFYELLWDIACADGVLASEEKEILIRICSHLKIPDFYFELNYLRRVSTFQEAHRHSRQTDEGSHVDGTASLADAYATLGCHPEATDEEVRRAYRTSAKTYHPDVLRANNVPDEMIAVATRKMVALNEAWARIRRARGL